MDEIIRCKQEMISKGATFGPMPKILAGWLATPANSELLERAEVKVCEKLWRKKWQVAGNLID